MEKIKISLEKIVTVDGTQKMTIKPFEKSDVMNPAEYIYSDRQSGKDLTDNRSVNDDRVCV